MDLYQKNLICDQFYVGAILGWTIGGHVGLHMLKRLGTKEEKFVSKCAYQMFCLKNTVFFGGSGTEIRIYYNWWWLVQLQEA